MSPSPLPPLTALRAFEAAVRLGSLTAAADELHVTHGAISRQLQALEAALGQPLMLKSGRHLQPTAAGRQLHRSTQVAFDQLRQTWAELQPRPAVGPLVLGCPGSVLARWMIPRLHALHRDLPDITLHLAAIDGEIDPALPGLDALLVIGQAPWPAGWRVHPLGDERIGPVFSPQLPQATTLRTAPASALLAAPLLHTTSRPQAWPAWLTAQQLDVDDLLLGQRFDHLYYLLEAARSGLGIAIAPKELVASDLQEGRLLAPWGFTPTGGHWVVCSRQQCVDPRIERLADWMRAQWASPTTPAY